MSVAAKPSDDMWAIDVAPGGDVAVLRHFRDEEAEDEWCDVDSLKTLHSSVDSYGISSASAQAIVEKWYGTFRIRPIGETPRTLCSGGFCDGNSSPLFLSDNEILFHSWRGFAVLSVKGEVLWSREQDLKNNCGIIATRSLDGSRFALRIGCQKKTYFDNIELRPRVTLIVYDRGARRLIFSLPIDQGPGDFDYALSPDGALLSVLRDTELDVYELPSLSKR